MNVTFKGYPSPIAPVTTSKDANVASNSGGASGSRGSVPLSGNKVAIDPGPSRTNKSMAAHDPLSAIGKVLSAVMPDALAVSNDSMLKTPNKKILLLNPAAASATYVTNHTGSTVGQTPSGLKLNRVTATHIDMNGKANGIEEGVGISERMGQGDRQLVFFLRTRSGTTANGKQGTLSAQFGWVGRVAAMKDFIKKMPDGGLAGRFKQGLQADVGAGVRVGVAYRGVVSVDPKTGKWTLKASGVEIPLPGALKGSNDSTPTKGIKPALNLEQKPIARINNEDSYKAGANPFQRADDTREASGKYVNHADPVACIAGDVLTLQDGLSDKGQANVRTNAQAASVVESAIDRRNAISPEMAAKSRFHMGATVSSHRMGSDAKARLDHLLVQLDRYGVFFGSSKVKLAAQEAVKGAGDLVKPPGNDDKAFVKDVFQGTYRAETKEQQFKDAVTGVKDMIVGINKVATAVDSVVFPEAAGTNSGMVNSAAAKGFDQRMKAGAGGTLAALEIMALPAIPLSSRTSAEYERVATNQLIAQLIPKLKTRDADGSRLYEAFKLLSPPERSAIATEVRKKTDERVDADRDTADPVGRAEVRKRDLLQQ